MVITHEAQNCIFSRYRNIKEANVEVIPNAISAKDNITVREKDIGRWRTDINGNFTMVGTDARNRGSK